MVFLKKRDAIIKIKKSNNPNLRLIQKDSDELGSKKFYVMTQNELYDQVKKYQVKDKLPCYYESWLDDHQILFSLDIDASVDLDDQEFDKVIKKNISKVIKYGKKFYEYEYKPFRGRNIVSGRRDYHHSICREILPRIGGLTFLLAEILNFSFLAQIWPFRGLNMNIV